MQLIVMLQDIGFVLWFFLPAAMANVAPIFAANMPLLEHWNAPLDGGHTFQGRPILGTHKTWRGLIVGIIAATLTLWLQQVAVAHLDWAQTLAKSVDYGALPLLILGPLFAIGALGGDAIKSFFKRRCGLLSGDTWIPFDQLDYIIGGAIVSAPFVVLSPLQYLWLVVAWCIIHLASSYIGWLLGLKHRPI